ncbi:hypothetical protein FGM01_05355 [Christiangramia sabulilitoris]|uniref:Uncharacterized protein n=2 Tax=Christiangramia sabulilitoris TaxID=2583991 RepID=A0A550I8L0_9FLAO|nr:hypothetical protein FGM01_05355 [Christiangramia sabulilitoris]
MQKVPDLDSRHGEFFIISQNELAVIFEIAGSEFTVAPSNKINNNTTIKLSSFEFNQGQTLNPFNRLSFSGFQLDHKIRLESQIYPFHFFW